MEFVYYYCYFCISYEFSRSSRNVLSTIKNATFCHRLDLLSILRVSTFMACRSFATWIRRLSLLEKLCASPALLVDIPLRASSGNETPGSYRLTENKRSSLMVHSSSRTLNEWATKRRTPAWHATHKVTAHEEHWKFKSWVSSILCFLTFCHIYRVNSSRVFCFIQIIAKFDEKTFDLEIVEQ